jgi:RNA polymerase sigma-32 factor
LVQRLRASGDRAAARSLVSAHLSLVVGIARGFRRLHPNLLELVQEGNLALIRAVYRYDPARRVTLAAYVSSWVRTYVGRFVLANLGPVIETDISSMRAVIARNLRESVRGWSTGIGEEEGEDPIGVDDPELAALALMAEETAAPSDLIAAREEEELLEAALPEFKREMSPRERDVFNARFASESPSTLAQTGARLGVSAERVRQIEEELADRLRTKVASRTARGR